MKKGKYFLCTLILLSLSFNGYSDDSYTKVSIDMANDNPFLNLLGESGDSELFYTEDDQGYTHGIGVEVEVVREDGIFEDGERWTIGLRTDLYTKNLSGGVDYFPNVPQKFNEVTRATITWDNLLSSQDSGKTYYLVEAGIGNINNADDSGWGAAGLQRRWHDYKHNNLTPETTPLYDNEFGNTNKVFVSAKGGIGKTFQFDSADPDCNCELDSVRVEAGVEFITIRRGSRAYLFLGIDKVAMRYGKNQKLGLELNTTINAYASGDVGSNSFVGIKNSGKKWTIRTGFDIPSGEQNNSLIKYSDDDPIWTIRFERKF